MSEIKASKLISLIEEKILVKENQERWKSIDIHSIRRCQALVLKDVYEIVGQERVVLINDIKPEHTSRLKQ